MVAVGDGHGVVDHHQGGGGHQHPGARHRDDRGRACCDAVDLDGDVARVVHQHRVDAAGCDAVATRRVEPDDHLPGSCKQLALELLGCDIVIEPALLGYRARQLKDPGPRPVFALVFPLPELPVLHRPPPGMYPCSCLRMPRPSRGGACFR
ncbi:hypothetical protein SDC9_133807 [bioreactor metagenome]|uniref:Uncharacterized protein n=1 Tax=bioreactor metagenome TaxID=1076179 RepID=A0A645DBA8_9ZZZZ